MSSRAAASGDRARPATRSGGRTEKSAKFDDLRADRAQLDFSRRLRALSQALLTRFPPGPPFGHAHQSRARLHRRPDLGLWATLFSLRNMRGLDTVTIGPWTVSEKAGTPEADPYARAALERSGEIPLALGEGLQLYCAPPTTRARRSIRVAPISLATGRRPARYWTLSLVDRLGFPVENSAARYGFRSSEIVREADGGFMIAVSASAHAGNWLPIGSKGRFALALRL